MTVETYDSNPQELIKSILVTPDALAHFHRLLQKSNNKGVRISLKESGCSGFKYVIEEVGSPQAGDITRQLADGVDLFVEMGCLAALKDLNIDVVKQGLNTNLVMNNPNVKDACGCGESFRV